MLGGQLGYLFSIEEIQRRFAEISNTTHKLYVAKDDQDQVLGWLQINREPASLLSDPRAEVSALVVDEKCRGKGIGTALLLKAEEWAVENKLSMVRIRSNTIRKEAHLFYQKQGYKIKKSWHLFTKKLF